jgi:hypothetical protein
LSYVDQELQFLLEENKKSDKDIIQKKVQEYQQEKGKLDKMLQQLNKLTGTEYDESTLPEVLQKTTNRKRKTVHDVLADQNFEQDFSSRLTEEERSSFRTKLEAFDTAQEVLAGEIVANWKKIRSRLSVSNSASKVCYQIH